MPFGDGMDMWQSTPGHLHLSEKKDDACCLTSGERKLFIVSAISLMMDSYDFVVFNLILLILRISYFHGQPIPWGLDGQLLKSAIYIGASVGHLLFGFLADAFGRHFLFAKIALLQILAIIPLIAAPNHWGGAGITYWIFVWRLLLGIAVGADFPVVGAIVAEHVRLRRRGAALSLVFAFQGLGALLATVCTAIVVGAYHGTAASLNIPANLRNPAIALSISGAWRILQGLVIVIALGTFFLRLATPESAMFLHARNLQDRPELLRRLRESDPDEDHATESAADSGTEQQQAVSYNTSLGLKPIGGQRHWTEPLTYFREKHHLQILVGTAGTWFLQGLTGFGATLVLTDILSAIHLTSKRPYDSILMYALGNLVVNVGGYLPGFYVCASLIEVVGRKPIEILGFFMTALFLFIMGGDYSRLLRQPAPFFIVFAFLQFFSSFGPVSTTFVVASEAFPSRVRGTASGFSGACGRVGTVIGFLGFYKLAKTIGTNKVLLILGALALLGIPFTLLLPETRLRDPDVLDRQELAQAASGKAYTDDP